MTVRVARSVRRFVRPTSQPCSAWVLGFDRNRIQRGPPSFRVPLGSEPDERASPRPDLFVDWFVAVLDVLT